MLVNDNFREVLMNCDITTIKQMVKVNKATASCCNDVVFWNNKFQHDGLLIINNKINTFKGWVKEYKVIYKCKKYSINRLLVNKMDTQKTYEGSIRFNIRYENCHEYNNSDENEINDSDEYVPNDIIPYYMLVKNDVYQIQIEFINDDKYKIWYYIDKCGYYIEDSLYDDVLNILIKMMYYSFKDNNIIITNDMWYQNKI